MLKFLAPLTAALLLLCASSQAHDLPAMPGHVIDGFSVIYRKAPPAEPVEPPAAEEPTDPGTPPVAGDPPPQSEPSIIVPPTAELEIDPATLCPSYDIEAAPDDAVNIKNKLRALGFKDRVCIHLKAGTYGRIGVENRFPGTYGEFVIVADPDARIDCGPKTDWIGAKGCIAAQGDQISSLYVFGLTIDASAMEGTGDRGIFAWFPIHLQDVIFDGCQESCVQGKGWVDWTLIRVRTTRPGSNKESGPVGHVVYSAPHAEKIINPDGTYFYKYHSHPPATLTIIDSDLWTRNKHVVKSNHARTVIRNSVIRGGDLNTAAEIGVDARSHVVMENVHIFQPLAPKGNRTIFLMGTGTPGRCEQHGPDAEARVEMKNVTVTDEETKLVPVPPRFVMLGCAADVPFVDLGGNSYNGAPFDFGAITRK